ncbi:MAG TPA: TonB-dependent receptor [Saprospiraceae bacterium]|nr:TonB-dependent receptor [Saprospiraceae bacterium]HMP25402.1 TonB-dependent receptor [Saprospiraceae bacterium]
MQFHSTLTRTALVLSLMLFAISAFAQSLTVSGKVSGPEGEPLIGATVQTKGSSTGTVTDVDGNYEIQVASAETVLMFSYVGYQTTEVTVGQQSVINIVLAASAGLLDEVVVIGYGTQTKSDVTGAISSVKGADIGNLPVIGASQALQGRAAGVNVVRNGGAPGNGGSIRIRGTGTVNDANPLIIVDDVPLGFGSINDINPNDIESIEILKDASSAAIYGQRAANGVIIVTTKKGGSRDRVSVEFNTYAGISNPVRTIDVLDAPTLAALKREAFTNDGLNVPDIWNEPAFQVQRTNWQDELLRTGITQNYDFAIRGGGNRSSFAFSGGYFDEKGSIDKTFFERYYIRLNSDHKINKWLTIGENLQFTRQRGNFLNTTSAQTGIIWSAIRFHPGLPVIVTEPLPGHEIGQYGSSQVSGQFGDINNPIFTMDTNDSETINHRLLGNVYADFQIAKGLKFRTNFALDGAVGTGRSFEIIVDRQIRANPRNRLNRSYNEGYSLLAEYFLTYDRVFANRHAINLVGGYTAQSFVSESFSAERQDFLNESSEQRFLSVGTAITNATGGRAENSLVSGFSRLNYTLDDKYLFSATFRADGSSRFAPGNRWGYFPAFSVGWRVSREEFFKNVDFISYLKLTGSWGQLGNQNVPNLQYLAVITANNRYVFNGQPVTGASQSRLADPNIQWERAEMTNIGAEIGFLENRLLTNVNYFIKDTRDMLLAPPVLGTVGTAGIPNQNVGSVRNQGLELELTYQNRATNNFTYSISGNAAFIRNEVTQLVDGGFLGSLRYGRPNEEIARTFEGHPMATFFGWRTNGLYQTQAEIDNDPNLANDPRRELGLIKPGDVRFLDLNGDGIIDDQDRTILGDPFPAITYGLNANFGYKGFDLGVFFLGVGGVSIYNADRMQGLDASYPFNMYAEVQDRWNGPGTSNSIPRLSTRRDNRNYRTSDLFLEDGSFLRLKNLTVGYTLPGSIAQKAGLSRLRFYITGQNVFTITQYSGLDPELGYTDGNLQQNVDFAQYPQTRAFIFGLTAGF